MNATADTTALLAAADAAATSALLSLARAARNGGATDWEANELAHRGLLEMLEDSTLLASVARGRAHARGSRCALRRAAE